MVKKRLKPNSFNDEIKRLHTVIEKIGDDSTMDSSLKNYLVYRLVGIYEIKVYETLKRQIDEDNPYKTTYGAAILESGTTHTYYIEENIATMLKHKSFEKNNYEIKCQPHFFDVFNAVFVISSPLKENFGKLFKNNFTYLIKNLVESRNNMTHNMTDVKYTKDQLNSILQLMRIFIYAFPRVYKFVESVILEKRNKLEKDYLQTNDALIEPKNKLYSSLIPLDEIIDVINQTFQRNAQNGTVEFYDELNGFGKVITSSGKKIRIIQENLEDVVEGGDKLEFEIKFTRNGPEAICIKVIS